MADRYPLVVDDSNFRIEELSVADDLNLNGSSLKNTTISGVGTISAGVSTNPSLYINADGPGSLKFNNTVTSGYNTSTYDNGSITFFNEVASTSSKVASIICSSDGPGVSTHKPSRFELHMAAQRDGINPSAKVRINQNGWITFSGSNEVGIGTTLMGIRPGSIGETILMSNSGSLYHQVPPLTYYTVTTAGGSTSDEAVKENITPITDALDKLSGIDGVYFNFIEEQMCASDNGQQIGVVAQQVEASFPEAVVNQPGCYKSVRYEKLIAPLIQAVKELKAENDALKARLDAAGI